MLDLTSICAKALQNWPIQNPVVSGSLQQCRWALGWIAFGTSVSDDSMWDTTSCVLSQSPGLLQRTLHPHFWELGSLLTILRFQFKNNLTVCYVSRHHTWHIALLEAHCPSCAQQIPKQSWERMVSLQHTQELQLLPSIMERERSRETWIISVPNALLPYLSFASCAIRNGPRWLWNQWKYPTCLLLVFMS